MLKARLAAFPLAFLGTAGLLAGCGSGSSGATAPTKPGTSATSSASASTAALKTFTIGYPAVDADFTVLWAGIDQGFFKKNGLDVKMSLLAGSGSETSALLSGSVNMVMSDSTPALTAMAQGAPIVLVGSDENVYPAQIVGKSSITSISQLVGKRLGLEHVHSLMWSAAIQALQDNHINPSSVTLDYLGAPPTNLAGLLAGKVDAIVNNSPFVNEAEAKGFHLIYSTTKVPHVSGGMLTSKAFASQHPNELTDFFKGYIEASVFVHNPANKAVVEKDISNAMHVTNPTLLNDIYNYFPPLLQVDPTIPTSTLAYTVNYVNQTTKKHITAQQAINLSVLSKLEQSGFVKKAQASEG